MKKLLLTLVLFVSILAYGQNSIATYDINFSSNWSEVTHPHPGGNFPASAHWSKLVGATHNENVIFVEMGALATPGIEDVAELGNNAVFFDEINTAIGQDNANQIIDGPSLGTALGQINIAGIATNEDFPLLTLVSMIAPSPDWMIAANSIELLDGNGDWKNEIIIDLYPYDAGTDSGVDYTSPNNNTNPPDPISSNQGVSPFSNEKVGTLTVTLVNVVLGVNDNEVSNEVSVFPNPATNEITISTSSDSISKVEIYNVVGEKIKEVATNGSKQLTISIAELTSGVYLVRTISDTNRPITKKLVKL